MRVVLCAALVASLSANVTFAQTKPLQRPPEAHRVTAPAAALVPEISTLIAARSELRDVVDRFAADRDALMRFENVQGSTERRVRVRTFYNAWLEKLPSLSFAALSPDGKADYVLLRNYLEYQVALLDREERASRLTDTLVPFADAIHKLQRDRQRLEFITPDAALAALAEIRASVRSVVIPTGLAPLTARLGAERASALAGTLNQWYGFYEGYDPEFTQRVGPVRQEIARLITEQASALRRIAGQPAANAPRAPGASLVDGPIVGHPIGRDGLMEDLAGELIVYTPEQLIEIGHREYAWCLAEMKKAARELGYGDDWLKALDYVKTQYVPRGGQPALIRDLALEAEAFLRRHDLVTIPPLASEVWRMQMMTAERQRINPFFTGGEVISVSYPTSSMSETDALMSMRGNGIHVSRATVQHELIPGHHLQGFMASRYNEHRALFSTPFMTEGWALYWELLLWDMGFPRSPEDRIGMLWWRMHRAGRIIFSLNYHLGRWTPEQSIDFLVDSVGHDRFTAAGEVRRSFEGNYSPLYQVAYMMGGLQIRALHGELVASGRMTPKKFHDTILASGRMPIEMLRALLTNQPLTPAYRAQWQYYGDVSPGR